MKIKTTLTLSRMLLFIVCVSLFCPKVISGECTYSEIVLYCRNAIVSFEKEKNINITSVSIVESDMRSIVAADFGTFRNLIDLYISNSVFPYSRLEGFFALLKHVQALTIISSHIPDDLEIMFPDNTSIKELKIFKNNFRFISWNFPRRFPFLREVDLSHNKISKINFRPMSNGTKSKPSSALSHLQYLSSISLRNNSLKYLRNFTFTNLSQIRTINLSFNQIEKIERIAFNISDGTHRVSLNLSRNALTLVEDGTFSLCSRVSVLDLSSNGIMRLQTNAFQGLSSLEELLLGKNKIKSVSPGLFGPLGSLRRLDLSGNVMFHIQDGAFACNYQLVDLRLRSNHLRQLTCASFFNLTSLQSLDLSGNSLGAFRFADFSHLKNLKTLSLDLHYGSECDCRVFQQMKERDVKLNINFTSLSDNCSMYWEHYVSSNQHWGRECSGSVTADVCRWIPDKKEAEVEEAGDTGGRDGGDGEGRSPGGEEWEGQGDTAPGREENDGGSQDEVDNEGEEEAVEEGEGREGSGNAGVEGEQGRNRGGDGRGEEVGAERDGEGEEGIESGVDEGSREEDKEVLEDVEVGERGGVGAGRDSEDGGETKFVGERTTAVGGGTEEDKEGVGTERPEGGNGRDAIVGSADEEGTRTVSLDGEECETGSGEDAEAKEEGGRRGSDASGWGDQEEQAAEREGERGSGAGEVLEDVEVGERGGGVGAGRDSEDGGETKFVGERTTAVGGGTEEDKEGVGTERPEGERGSGAGGELVGGQASETGSEGGAEGGDVEWGGGWALGPTGWAGAGAAGAVLCACVAAGAAGSWWASRRGRREAEHEYAMVDFSRVTLNWLPPTPPPPPPPRPIHHHLRHQTASKEEDDDEDDDAYQKPRPWPKITHGVENITIEGLPKEVTV